MPITSSAKKALRQNKRRRAINIKRKNALRAVIKQYKKLLAVKDFEKARAYLPSLHKALDKAAKSGFIKKNKADRLKSRLGQRLRQDRNQPKP